MTDQTWPENAWPTPEQYLDWLLTLDRQKQVSQVESRLLDAEHAHRCVLRNHDGMEAEIKWLREQVARTTNPTPAEQGAVEQQEAS